MSKLPPLPATYITLDPFDRPVQDLRARYTSGDVVRGAVRIQPTSRPQRISISFRGRTDMTMEIIRMPGSRLDNFSGSYQETVELFKYDLDLFTSAGESGYDIVNMGIAADGRVELPFAFKFPHAVEIVPPKEYLPNPGFEHQVGHRLPPSYHFSGPHGYRVETEYWLEAFVYGFSKADPEQKVKHGVWYQPPTLSPQPLGELVRLPSKRVAVRTPRLDPDRGKEEGLLAKWQIHRKKGQSTTPFAAFDLSVNIAPVFIAGALLPIKMSLEHLERSPELIDPPTLYLRRMKISLVSKAGFRLRSHAIGNRGDYEESREDLITIIDKRFLKGPGELIYDGQNLNELATVRTSEVTAPSFKSFSTSVQYFLEVKFWIECGKEERIITPDRHAIHIVSGVVTEEHLNQAMVTAAISEPEDEMAPPPAYAPPAYEDRNRDFVVNVGRT
ncbi:hypothetical protein BS50DRAFT_7539 [Corynespora cassiicola Philippines]|uniref:Arrestin-like N-terminal domain-containing protein n=1 Tax=Corynespora cassiicola Philippines TaxID=1448308 RepID=A0A2T2P9Q2_CORCC|nr:hypothetical protein BS50DRAFT_7539 [Corynespora cassiicola Philippines]